MLQKFLYEKPCHSCVAHAQDALRPAWRGSPCADGGENRLVGCAGELPTFCRPARPRARPVSRAAAYGATLALRRRRGVGGTEAGTRDRPRSPRTMEGWWGRGGRLASGLSSAPPTQRQGRAIRCRAAHRARTRARGASKRGQFSCASNEPMFAAIGARGAAPRRLQCAIDDECTPTCTFPWFFIQKLCRNGADLAAEGSLAS